MRRRTYPRLLCLILVFISPLHAAQDYVLGPGDVVRMTVYAQPDLATVTRISASGKCTLPLLGEVALGGKTLGQAEIHLATLLQQGNLVNNPQVSLLIEQYYSRQVAVLGEVNKPGKYVIEGTSNVVDVIAMAGGLTAQGGDRVKVIKKSGDDSQRVELDLSAVFQQGDMSKNITIDSGDIVFVPRMELFYIYGEVQRPGAFRLERSMTVMQALAIGGGLNARGTDKGIRIKRRGLDNTIETLDGSLATILSPDDVVYVRESLF